MRVFKISTLLLAFSVGALALAPARAETDQKKGPQARIEHMCSAPDKSEKFAEAQAKRAARMGEALKLTDAQMALFKDLQAVHAKNRADMKAAICANKPDLSTFANRLAFREVMAQRRLDNMKTANPKMIAFYNSLDEGQKAKFEASLHHRAKKGMKKMEAPKGGEGSDDQDEN